MAVSDHPNYSPVATTREELSIGSRDV